MPGIKPLEGFSPATVIDVGVANGTHDLYATFPDAYYVLVEPVQEFEPVLQAHLDSLAGEYLVTAVGDGEGSLTLNVDNESPWTTSALTTLGPTRPLERRTVPLTTLDRLQREHQWDGPFGLKIDTEGFEDQVIRGAADLLRDTQFVIAEVSVGRRFEGGYTFAQFVAMMNSHGFQLSDILEEQRNANGKLICMDAMFAKAR